MSAPIAAQSATSSCHPSCRPADHVDAQSARARVWSALHAALDQAAEVLPPEAIDGCIHEWREVRAGR